MQRVSIILPTEIDTSMQVKVKITATFVGRKYPEAQQTLIGTRPCMVSSPQGKSKIKVHHIIIIKMKVQQTLLPNKIFKICEDCEFIFQTFMEA